MFGTTLTNSLCVGSASARVRVSVVGLPLEARFAAHSRLFFMYAEALPSGGYQWRARLAGALAPDLAELRQWLKRDFLMSSFKTMV